MFVQIDNTLFQTKMIAKWRKYMNDLLKIIHWRIMWTVSTKLGLKSSLDKGNSNEGSCLFPGTCILKGWKKLQFSPKSRNMRDLEWSLNEIRFLWIYQTFQSKTYQCLSEKIQIFIICNFHPVLVCNY